MTFHSGFGFGSLSVFGLQFAPTATPNDPFVGPFPGPPPGPGPSGITPLVPSGPGEIQAVIRQFGCEILTAVPGICANPISRAAAEALCPGGCGRTPTFDDIADPTMFLDPISGTPQGNGSVGACPTLKPKSECTVTRNTKCGPIQIAGRLKIDCATGRPVCVPKPRRMNPMNAKANRRSMSRLKGAHREANKIIDTLDSFAKPRRARAPSRKKACAC